MIGVVEIVGADQCPEPIADDEIAAIKNLMASVLPYGSHPYLHEGMQVEVVRGPLQGVRLIQRAAAVEIDISNVVPQFESLE